MTRSGYSDDCKNVGLWRGSVRAAISGKRGQRFLRDLARTMDAMPEKILISDELINKEGDCCAIGVVCKSRGVDVDKIDYEDPAAVGDAVGISMVMAAEIEYENDEGHYGPEKPEDRWVRMRKWVQRNLKTFKKD